MVSIDKLVNEFKEAIEEEISDIGVAEWSSVTAGVNLLGLDYFGKLSVEELREVIEDIQENSPMIVEIDLNELMLVELEDLLSDKEELEYENDDDYEED